MWKWVKVPKGIALLAFLAPWMTVSCQGQPLARAYGWQLVLGKSSPVMAPNGGGSAPPTPTSPAELNIWLILALVVIVAGLAIACLKYSKQMSLAVVVTSVVSLLLIYVGTIAKYNPAELLKGMPKSGGETPGMDPAALQAAIQITWEWGFWLALIALVAAGVMAFLAYSGKDAAIGAVPPGEPPAV